MNYHAPTKQMTVSIEQLARASTKLLYAIRDIRDGANLDRKGYDYLKRKTDWAEVAEDAILNAARDLGIHLGADHPGQLDVSKP
jgi:hypothetical protein